ncbi:hypothetical protein [Mesorhizobium sp.]|nr:hypothetical protein [Mesorhizobium sp.]
MLDTLERPCAGWALLLLGLAAVCADPKSRLDIGCDRTQDRSS